MGAGAGPMTELPPLPPGFVLETPTSPELPPLPPGFVLEGATQQATVSQETPKKFGLGDTWPAKLAKQAYGAVTLPGEVYQGTVPVTGEDGRTSSEVVRRAADLSLLASPMNPAVRAGDRVITGVARGSAPGRVPSSESLKQAASEAYQSPEIVGLQVRPSALERMAQEAQAALNVKGVDENLAPKTFGVLRKAGEAPEEAIGVTGHNLESLRRTLGTAAKSADPTERMAASHAMNALDDFISKLPAADVVAGDAAKASVTWDTARANYGAAMRSDRVQKAVNKAELQAASTGSGANIDNALRQQVKSILNNENKLRGYSPEEVAQMRQIVEGTRTGNFSRLVGKLAPTGIVSGALSAGSGFAAGGAAGAAVVPAVGLVGKFIADKLTQKQVSRLDELVRSRSPLARAVQSSSSKWGEAADALAGNPSGPKLAAFLLASRNLSNTMNAAGIPVPVRDLIRYLQTPMRADTEAEQQNP